LPAELPQLAELRTIFLRSNAFEHVPEVVGELPRLEYLSLQYNKLTTLPVRLGNEARLTHLFLRDNRLPVVRNAKVCSCQWVLIDRVQGGT
jgi:Leucine-rich repeat (LRR) protein